MFERRIGCYTGAERGPLVIALGAVHGNEPAGVTALEWLFQRLESEPSRRPHFCFKGRLVGLLGNKTAFEAQKRYIDQDLNRCLFPDALSDATRASVEMTEARALVAAVQAEINAYQPSQVYVLDLHTTSANGGIFTIVAPDEAGLAVAVSVSAPVVLGLLGPIGGSTLHFFSTANMGVPTVALGFEGGQHQDRYAPSRILAFMVQVLRAVGCVAADDVESQHEAILTAYGAYLPKIVTLLAHHKIDPQDGFEMLPGFDNFQFVRQGQTLAKDKKGWIKAPEDCRILMPLYQTQGSDGFFLVKDVS